MDKRSPFLLLMLATAVLFAVLFAGAGILLLSRSADPAVRASIVLTLEVTAFITAVLLLTIYTVLYFYVISPLRMLSREIRIISDINPGYVINVAHPHFLGDIPKAAGDIGAALMKARREIAEAVSAGSSDMEDRKARLDTILSSLREGIIVCDDKAHILFYNPAAKRVFNNSSDLALGRSLYKLCTASPIESTLALLKQRSLRSPKDRDTDNGISFVCSTLAGTIISSGMRLLPAVPGLSWSFLFVCEDISRETDASGRRQNLLRSALRGMQTSLTSLILSADSLELLPDIDTATRATLEKTISADARSLASRYDVLAREIEELEPARYLMNDVSSDDAVACVARRLEEKGLRLTLIGDPLWVRTDIHSLLLLLEFLALRIHEHAGARNMEVETLLGDKRVYFNFYWPGEAVPEAEIRDWKSRLPEAFAAHTVSDVLERLGSEIWSSPHHTPGFAILRLPLPSSTRQWEPAFPLVPARPVYTDFSATEEAAETSPLRDLPLSTMTFVVFDTETTGLTPLEGDEIISLAGVKIIKRGIIVGETFDELVNPGRSIPQSSVRIHGITADMVGGKPPLEEVLGRFHAFVGNAVLVGHNAAFDMRFIRMKEGRANVRFRGPVLDTLELSRYLHAHTPEHSLDAVARRLGVEVRGRHTALGDSLITAQIFVKFLFLLQEKGITTLGQMLEAVRQ
ncbi:MAG: PAS domain-containing protein [Nitrospirae bacterium]|nr:MAG: PAS domain-containing protein [Nitrospirota bacterium]